MARNRIFIFTAMLLAGLAVLIASCRKSAAYPTETRDLMGTSVTITVFDPGVSASDMKPVFSEIFTLLADWERQTLLPGTLNQVWGLSKSAGNQSVPLDPQVFKMLMKALQFYDASGKVFDVRYGPMLDAWQFEKNPRVPSKSMLDSLQSLVINGGMFVAGNSILLAKPNMRFDAREIAVGYGLDLAAVKLAERGIRTAMIHTPRVCRTMGDPPNRKGFPFKVANPLTPEKTWGEAWVPVGGTAYASVGVDRFMSGGKAYHSLLDPRTGLPADQCTAVLVHSPDAVTAQAFAYAVFVWGMTDSLSAEGKKNVDGSVIVREQGGKFSVTENGSLADRFEFSK
jgi:FAD:protein FMN transferase